MSYFYVEKRGVFRRGVSILGEGGYVPEYQDLGYIGHISIQQYILAV